jgi:hypothetical protein
LGAVAASSDGSSPKRTPMPSPSLRAAKGSSLIVSATTIQGVASGQDSRKTLEPGKFEFNDLDPDEVADQLTLIEWEMYCQVDAREFLHLNWKKEDAKKRKLATNVINLVERFNAVSYWVATEIVMQTDVKTRVQVLKKFIGVAERMRTIGNFNGVMEIIGGLNQLAVQRLKETWAQIPTRLVGVVEELNGLMSNLQNYKEYRNAISSTKGPTLPYLGVYLRDIIFIDEGNPNYVGDKREGLINFEKLQLIGDVLVQLKKWQASGYFVEPNWVMREYLEKLLVLPEEMLYKHSILCEPNRPSSDEANK